MRSATCCTNRTQMDTPLGELIEGMLGSDALQEQYMFLHVQETWPTAADHSDHPHCIALDRGPECRVQRGARREVHGGMQNLFEELSRPVN